jgi:predicted deacylase
MRRILTEGVCLLGDDGASAKGGPGRHRIAIVGGIHGDEPDGAAVVQEMAERGEAPGDGLELLLVVGNPAALRVGRRCTDGGADLNRMFGETGGPASPVRAGAPAGGGECSERTRAQELRPLLAGLDLLLDLHQTRRPIPPVSVVPDSEAHLALAAALGLETAVVGAERIYGERFLASEVDRRGGIGLTVETGMAGSDEARQTARELARRFIALAAQGLVAQTGTAPRPLRVYALEDSLLCPGPGLRFARALDNATAVRDGELLGTWDGASGESGGRRELRAPRDAVIFLPREHAAPGEPCMLLARDRGQLSPSPPPRWPFHRSRG